MMRYINLRFILHYITFCNEPNTGLQFSELSVLPTVITVRLVLSVYLCDADVFWLALDGQTPSLDRIARTTYVDAVYCYQPSSVVCLSH